MFQKQVGWATWLHQLLTCQANIRDIVVNHRCTHQNPWWYISGKIAKDVIAMQVQEKLKSTLGYCFHKLLNPWRIFSWPDQEFTKVRKEEDQKKKRRCAASNSYKSKTWMMGELFRPGAAFISREIGFGLQITSFATVVTKRKMFGRTQAKKAKWERGLRLN